MELPNEPGSRNGEGGRIEPLQLVAGVEVRIDTRHDVRPAHVAAVPPPRVLITGTVTSPAR